MIDPFYGRHEHAAVTPLPDLSPPYPINALSMIVPSRSLLITSSIAFTTVCQKTNKKSTSKKNIHRGVKTKLQTSNEQRIDAGYTSGGMITTKWVTMYGTVLCNAMQRNPIKVQATRCSTTSRHPTQSNLIRFNSIGSNATQSIVFHPLPIPDTPSSGGMSRY